MNPKFSPSSQVMEFPRNFRPKPLDLTAWNFLFLGAISIFVFMILESLMVTISENNGVTVQLHMALFLWSNLGKCLGFLGQCIKSFSSFINHFQISKVKNALGFVCTVARVCNRSRTCIWLFDFRCRPEVSILFFYQFSLINKWGHSW